MSASNHPRLRFCITAGALLAGCVETYDGNGTPAEEIRALSGVEKVASRGLLDVQLTRAEAFALTVRIDENLIARVVTSVNAGTLLVELEGGNLGEHLPGPHVIVTLPRLLDAELTGSGRLSAEGFEGDEPVSLELVGSGELSWSGQASDLEGLLRGSGSMALTGSATSVDLRLEGSGELDARGLTAGAASIDLTGSGSISASVDGRVDARVEGSGQVDLYGDVTRGDWEEIDGGSVNAP